MAFLYERTQYLREGTFDSGAPRRPRDASYLSRAAGHVHGVRPASFSAIGDAFPPSLFTGPMGTSTARDPTPCVRGWTHTTL